MLYRSLIFTLLSIFVSSLSLANSPQLNNIFVSVNGSGDRSGSTLVNSLPFKQLKNKIETLTTSYKVVFSEGRYNIAQSILVEYNPAIENVVFEGIGDTIFASDYDLLNPGSNIKTAFKIGRSNVEFTNLKFENIGTCVKAISNTTSHNVLISGLTAHNVHSCIMIDRSSNSDINNWMIQNVDISSYYRVGIRLAGNNVNNIALRNITLDGEQTEGESYCWKGGIQILKGASNIQIIDADITNNVGSCGSRYRQGDGIEIDHKDGTPENITLSRVKVSNSGDANFDFKGSNIVMSEMTSIAGPLTRHAYKFWAYDNYRCIACSAQDSLVSIIDANYAKVVFSAPDFKSTYTTKVCRVKHHEDSSRYASVSFLGGKIETEDSEFIDNCGIDPKRVGTDF